MSGNVAWGMVTIGIVCSMYLAGRLAERRGRNFRTWAGIASVIGPLALPLVLLFPDMRRRNGDQA